MSLNMSQAWLTRDAFDRVKCELAALINERHAADDDDARMRRKLRIRQLQELVQNVLLHEPADDGVAEPGMVVTVRYDGEDVTETFLIADREESAAADPSLGICSPHSPLGTALVGAVEGDVREFATPGGGRVTVTVLKAVPHRPVMQ